MHPQDPDLAHVGVGDDLEDMGQHMLAGVRLGMEGLGIGIAQAPLVERRRVAFGGIRRKRSQRMHQVVEAGTGPGRDKQDGYQVALAQGLLEGGVQFARSGVLAVLEVARQQVLVFLDQLVDQLAVGVGDGIEVGIAGVVLEHFDDIGAVMRRQVEQLAFVAEALADIGDQTGQVEVVGIDLVDDDHPRQATLLCPAHHALRGQLNAGLGIDDDQGGIDSRQ